MPVVSASSMKIYSIQFLRGIAALMVLFLHTPGGLDRFYPEFSVRTTGAAGVDIFFVISGFIMVYTTWGKFRKPEASWAFLKSRASRILPTYYLFTTFTLVVLLFFPHWYHKLKYDPGITICSYLLILSDNNLGFPGTLVGVGWTLAFEAFFFICCLLYC